MMNVTGRDEWIIAKALHVASVSLKAEAYPEYSDIADMEEILKTFFSQFANLFPFLDDIKFAASIGFYDDPANRDCTKPDQLRAAVEKYKKTRAGKLKSQ